MDQLGLEAVGIGAEADIKNSELFASTERWRPTLEARWRGAACCYDMLWDMFVNPRCGSFVPDLRIDVAEA